MKSTLPRDATVTLRDVEFVRSRLSELFGGLRGEAHGRPS